MYTKANIPTNEVDRLLKLSELDLDYTELNQSFKDLARLAAKIAGTSISMINLIDQFTQWTISESGLPIEQMPREDSVCQYTILQKQSFEIKDLTADVRFKDRQYVIGPPKVKYYLGIPLQTEGGINIGSLCVMDQIGKEISPEKIEMLKIIADEIVHRLKVLNQITQLQNKVKDSIATRRRVAHDIRGPLGGIVCLAQIVIEQSDQNKMDQVIEFMQMIEKGGNSLLDLVNEILNGEKQYINSSPVLPSADFNLQMLKNKLERLYQPQAIQKNIQFNVSLEEADSTVPLSKNLLLQIAGNLISNAIKFTETNGKVDVTLGFRHTRTGRKTLITVKDNSKGMDPETIELIQNGKGVSTIGTHGEEGYGFGLSMVKHLIQQLKGEWKIVSAPNEGTLFEVMI